MLRSTSPKFGDRTASIGLQTATLSAQPADRHQDVFSNATRRPVKSVQVELLLSSHVALSADLFPGELRVASLTRPQSVVHLIDPRRHECIARDKEQE